MRAIISTGLECAAAKAWGQVVTPELLLHVMDPMIQIVPLDPPVFPGRWQQGTTYRFRARAFGIVPLGVHRLGFETVDDVRRAIVTREGNALVPVWNHRISIRETDEGTCAYRDDVEVSAGLLTLPVWLFANLFYRHRQRRWRRLARRL